MPGTVVETHDKAGPIGVITLTCTGDASDGSFPSTALTTKISGRLLALETNPGATAPTANYDIVLNDPESYDVLEAVGANRHTTTTEKVQIVYSGTAVNPPVAISDTLTLVVTNNAVNDAITVIKIYYEGFFE
jgi:hypothetical protein